MKKKFKSEEANLAVELNIEIEAYINKLTRAFESGKIEPELYIKKRNTIVELIKRSKELVISFRKEITI
jgi:hypothetical protein